VEIFLEQEVVGHAFLVIGAFSLAHKVLYNYMIYNLKEAITIFFAISTLFCT
jgi:hypothetical protein